MRTILIAGLGALALGGAAFAQDINTGHLAALDTNADGAVDAAEFAAFVDASFAAMDTNKDGYVVVTEATVTMTPEQFAAVNANGDNGLSKEEYQAATQADFAAADQDGDGLLN